MDKLFGVFRSLKKALEKPFPKKFRDFFRRKTNRPTGGQELELPTRDEDEFLVNLRQHVSIGDPSAKYILMKKIGKGGFGSVFKAIDKTTGERVAIKICTVFPEHVDLFITEITTMKTIGDHDNIVKFYDAYLLDDELWIIMEYISGETISDIAEKEIMDEHEIASVCQQTLQAIEHVHAKSFIHRDLKPDNILIDSEGSVKLIDFGLSCQLDPNSQRPNSLCGTVYYLAPEVACQTEYGPKVDIWSLGIAIIFMNNGEPPYAEYDELDTILDKIIQGEEIILDGKDHSSEFLDFLNRCLQRDETKRATAAQLLKHPFLKKEQQRQTRRK